MARSHVTVWTGALVAACVAALAAANCGSRCTDTTFRAYTSCLQSCGANVAVTTCDCASTPCARCPGDNNCCQTCCNLNQCVCSKVNCQQPCNNACCSMCCQPPAEQAQCGNCAPGCQQQQQQQGTNCSPCCQTTTTTTGRPPVSQVPTAPQPPPPPPPPPQLVNPPPIYVNVSVPPTAVNISLPNITVPTNINVLPPNISFTPHITLVVNTSPISQVYPTAGNVSLVVQQVPGPAANCTNGKRRCCRVVMAPPYPCPPGVNCPPIVRYGCGDQCSIIVQSPIYYQPVPRPVFYPVYYPEYYPVYRPVYIYVPQTSTIFCSTGCQPMTTWPFARCFDTGGFTPYYYSAGGMAASPQYAATNLGPIAAYAAASPVAGDATAGGPAIPIDAQA